MLQVMETKNMIYIVSEYASQGEIFGKLIFRREHNSTICLQWSPHKTHTNWLWRGWITTLASFYGFYLGFAVPKKKSLIRHLWRKVFPHSVDLYGLSPFCLCGLHQQWGSCGTLTVGGGNYPWPAPPPTHPLGWLWRHTIACHGVGLPSSMGGGRAGGTRREFLETRVIRSSLW